jgi:DUF4097 and DUF4098 domain-containing protein YvlB
MGEEQKQILQMVADGKISAEDGAKLLEALETGAERRESDSTRHFREKRRVLRDKMRKGGFTGLDALKDIGRMVRGMVSESVSEIEDDFLESDEHPGHEEGTPITGPVDIEEGSSLHIRRKIRSGKGGDLVLNGTSGSTLEAEGDEAAGIMTYTDGSDMYVTWSEGDLRLSVPEAVTSVSVSLLGGSIASQDVRAPLKFKTKGGDIEMSGVSDSFRVKTMGGDIHIGLGSDWKIDSNASTMGGNISLNVSGDTKALISAKTMGGEIQVAEGLGSAEESGHPGSSRVRIDLSDGAEAPDIRLKTMGGNISVTSS